MKIKYTGQHGTYKKKKLKTLIVNQEYNVLGEIKTHYKIRNSLGRVYWYLKHNFIVSEKTAEPKGVLKLQKDLHRTLKICNNYRRANDAKKIKLKQCDELINFLLIDNRVTKEELSRFFITKKKDIYAKR